MYELGLHYKDIEDYPNMIKYLAISAMDILGDEETNCDIQNINDHIIDIEDSTKSLKLLCDEINKSPNYFNYLTEYQKEQIAEYYIHRYALGYDAPIIMLEDYYNKNSEYEKIEHLLLLRAAIEEDDGDAMNELGILYYKKKDYNLMAQFFGMAMTKNNVNAYDNMSKFYEKSGNNERKIRYKLPITNDKKNSNIEQIKLMSPELCLIHGLI